MFNAEVAENAEVKEEARESMSKAKVRQAWEDILPRMRGPEAQKEGGKVNAIVRLLFWPGEFKVLAAVWAASPGMQEIH